MSKIDVLNWKEFHLYDVFGISMGNKLDRGKMVDGGIAFVGRTANNNGINARVERVIEHDKYGTVEPYEAGGLTLALGGSIGACFYQSEPFYTSQNVAVLIPQSNQSEYAMMFVATVITHCVSNGKYEAFSEELNKHIRTDFVIKLPATSEGKPDWDYMESYMRSVMDDCERKYKILVDIAKEKHKIDVSGWGEFKVEELFECVTVKHKLSKADLNDAGHPVYSSDTSNNGILGFCADEPEFIVDSLNPVMIVFGDHTRSMNIVTESFSVMDNVKVLKPVCTNIAVLLFLTTVWRSVIPDLGYARHWLIAKDSVLMLPITSLGKPDWDWMESYMQGVMDKQQNVVQCLKQINESIM